MVLIYDLPTDSFHLIFGHFSAFEVSIASQVCRQWRTVASDDSIWRKLVLEFVSESETAGRSNLRKYYSDLYRSWYPYRTCYRHMKDISNRFDAWLDRNANAIYRTLAPPATEEALNELETAVGNALPLTLRCFYRFHDGQQLEGADEVALTTLGCFGGFQFYDYHSNTFFLNLRSLPSMLSSFAVVPPALTWFKHCLPFATSNSSDKIVFVVLTPLEYPRLTTGAIVEFGARGNPVVVAPSFDAWLGRWVASLEAGLHDVTPEGEIVCFENAEHVVATTRGVRIQVSTLFVPERSAQQYFFAYRVRMSMHENYPTSETCTLVSRHWVIEEEEGESETSGGGVVGEYPQMYPGAFFEYKSCCPISSTTGSMRGEFQMRVDATGEVFDAIVPQFHFRVPDIAIS